MPILGYRIGKIAYITDMLTMPEESFKQLEGVEVLILNALRSMPHLSHQTLEDALEVVKRIAPKQTYLIHMSHHMGLHDEVQKNLPADVYLAYDGMEFTL